MIEIENVNMTDWDKDKFNRRMKERLSIKYLMFSSLVGNKFRNVKAPLCNVVNKV